MACEVNRGFDKEYHSVTLTDGRCFQAFKLNGKWYKTSNTRFPNKDTAIEYARHRHITECIVEVLPNGEADLHYELENVQES